MIEQRCPNCEAIITEVERKARQRNEAIGAQA